jgi:Flp pilus assembly protein TadG
VFRITRSPSPADPAPGNDRLLGERGAVMAEFALMLPFLAVIVFGTIDVGRAFTLKNSLTNMARQGAEVARANPYNLSTACTPSITTVARREDTTVTNATVTVVNVSTGAVMTSSPCNTPYTPRTRVRVRVSAPMLLLTPFVPTEDGGTITIANSVEVLTPQG